MWIYHPKGFVSIVENEDNPTTLLVRSRFPADLSLMFPGCAVSKTPERDYMYRTTMSRHIVAAQIANCVQNIDYPNFKNAAPKKRQTLYGRVWGADVQRSIESRLTRPLAGSKPTGTQWVAVAVLTAVSRRRTQMNVTTLRPGLLVSLKTSVSGNTQYRRFQLEAEHLTPEGTQRARWETERTTIDPKEWERAGEVRSQCRGLIYRACSPSMFGLLCPEDKQDELRAAVDEARALATAFNRTAKMTHLSVLTLIGRVAPDDVEAVRAINGEVRGLLEDMEKGIKALDVKMIRDAAYKAKSIGQMLTPAAAERIKSAVDMARETARKIVKAGDNAAIEIDRATVRKIRDSRTAFLDLDEAPAKVAKPKAKGRAVDFDPAKKAPVAKPKARKQAELEL